MLNFSDVATPPDEMTTDKVGMQVRPSDRERVSWAAELTGVEFTKFVWASAAKEAERVLREHRTTTLSEREWQLLLKALDNPPTRRPGTGFAATDPGSQVPGDDRNRYCTRFAIGPLDPRQHGKTCLFRRTDRLDNFLMPTARKQNRSDLTPVFIVAAKAVGACIGRIAQPVLCLLNAWGKEWNLGRLSGPTPGNCPT